MNEEKMLQEKALKEELTKYRDNSWKIPDDVDGWELIHRMMDNLDSLDGDLRDYLISTGFDRVILDNRCITPEQSKQLIYECLSDDFLFDGINEASDKIFKRSFAVLFLETVLRLPMKYNLINKDEFIYIFNELIRYIRLEKDYTGFDTEKGWAHATSHSADTLYYVVQYDYVQRDELLVVLNEIKRRATIDTYYFVNQEDESQVNVVESIYKKHILSDDDFIKWIMSFSECEKKDKYPAIDMQLHNRTCFLRSLYFRLINGGYNNELSDAVNMVLNMKKNNIIISISCK